MIVRWVTRAATYISQRLSSLVKAVLGVWIIIGLPFLFFAEMRENVSPAVLALICLPAVGFVLLFATVALLLMLEQVATPFVRLFRRLRPNG